MGHHIADAGGDGGGVDTGGIDELVVMDGAICGNNSACVCM